MSSSKRVAIIGAGSGGIVCAKVLLDDGFDVILFERNKELGGTWSPTNAYADLHTQQPGGTLEFSDLHDGKEFASWQHVYDYLKKYARLFHIMERIQFQTRVLSVSKVDLKDDSTPWIIQTETIDGKKDTKEFDFVIVASGLYSQPYIPKYCGQNKFVGSIVSPSDIKSHEQIIDKRVIVVGGGKSALDMAVLAGRYARSCYFVFRKAHWIGPRTIMNGLFPLRVFLTRALSIPFTPFPGAPHSKLFRYLHKMFPTIFTTMTDVIQNDFISINGPDLYNDKIFLPQYPFRNVEVISIIPNDFIQLKREGRINGRLGTIEEITDTTFVRLNTGEELEADMIISATGFIRSFPFFTEQQTEMMGLSEANGSIVLNLYRRIIPVDIPKIAFVGFTGVINHWQVAEVASHWISDYFLKRLKLPDSKEKMLEEIKINHDFIIKTFSRDQHEHRYYWAALLEIYLNDMDLSLHRTSNWISEYFGVYRPDRLQDLHNERKAIAETGRRLHRFYFSFQLNIFLFLLVLFIYRIF